MRYYAHSCAHWLGIWCLIPLYKGVNRYPILISTIEMNPEIYHERSNESPKLPKRVQKLPNLSEMPPESFLSNFRGGILGRFGSLLYPLVLFRRFVWPFKIYFRIHFNRWNKYAIPVYAFVQRNDAPDSKLMSTWMCIISHRKPYRVPIGRK